MRTRLVLGSQSIAQALLFHPFPLTPFRFARAPPTMKIRRTSQHVDLRTYPLDGVDTYLLSRVEEPLTREELAEVMPCPLEETAQRVQRLRTAGLLSYSYEDGESDSHLVDIGLSDLPQPNLDDDSDLALDFDETEEALPYPEPEASFDELEGAAAQAALFAAEPPSTLISLFKRGPLKVAINTVSPPAPVAQVKAEGSNVFRRPTAPDIIMPHDEPTKTHALAKGEVVTRPRLTPNARRGTRRGN